MTAPSCVEHVPGLRISTRWCANRCRDHPLDGVCRRGVGLLVLRGFVRRLRTRRGRRSRRGRAPRRRGPCRTAIPRRDRSFERLRPPTSRSVRLRRPAVARWPGCFRPRPGMRPSVATVVRHPSCGGRRGPCPCSATRTAPRCRRRRAGHAGSAAAAPDRIARRPRVPRSPVAIRTGMRRSRAAWRTRTLVSSESHSSTRMSTPSRNRVDRLRGDSAVEHLHGQVGVELGYPSGRQLSPCSNRGRTPRPGRD